MRPSDCVAIPGLELKGTAAQKSAVLSFVLTDPPLSTLDVGTQLDLRGICIRTGHHCCQPLMERLGVPQPRGHRWRSTIRARMSIDFADALAEILEQAVSGRQRVQQVAGWSA